LGIRNGIRRVIEMFKTKEELLNSGVETKYYKEGRMKAYQCGVYDALDSFAERVEFYKKYIDNFGLMYEEHSDDIDVCIIWEKDCSVGVSDKEWRDWLFDFCFGDIL
jgi:hypothetical protein